MSKIVSGIGKAVGGIVKGVTKAFKAVTKSKIGKVLMIAAAVYLGGAAMGMWNSPFSAINGVLTGQAPAAAELAGAAASGGGTAAEAALAGAGATGEAATVAAGLGDAAGGVMAAEAAPAAAEIVSASQAAQAVQPGLVESAISNVGNPGWNSSIGLDGAMADSIGAFKSAMGAAPVQSTTGGGIVDSAINAGKKVMGWAEKNPISAAMSLNAVANMSKPNELEMLDAKAQKEMELYDWKNKYLSPNWNVGGVNLGMQPGQTQLQYRNTGQPVYGPGGVINTAMKG